MKLLQNVKIYTMDDQFSVAEAMVFDNNSIIATGDRAKLQAQYPDCEIIDGQSCVVLPGFIDAHIHLWDGVIFRNSLDCTPKIAPTIAALKKLLSEASNKYSKGQWIVGQGYDPWKYPDKRTPTRYDLDEACPDHPAVVFHYSFHECVVNSKALKRTGIDRNTPQPFGGEIFRDRNGEPTGHLIETGIGAIQRLSRINLIQHDKETILASAREAQSALFGAGITRIGDLAVSSELEALYKDAYAGNYLEIPVVLHYSSDEGMFKLPWDRLENPIKNPDRPEMIPGPLKFFLDGADRAAVELSIARFLMTAAATLWRCVGGVSLDPIRTASRRPMTINSDLKVQFGTLMAKMDECNQLVAKAAKMGLTPAFHAIGNSAISQAIEIVEQNRGLLQNNPAARIEHGLFLDDAMIYKIKSLGIALVTQPYLLTQMSKENIPYLPGLKQLPLRSLIDAGVRVAGSSDWPVASFEPLKAIERAISRITRGTKVLQSREAITAREAINMYTNDSAYALGCTKEVGSLERGKRPDFVLLSDDPFRNYTDVWSPPSVRQTWLGGRQVYSTVS